MPCILTGRTGNDSMTVDPMHIGTAGERLKSPDNECLPVIHSLHLTAHTIGEISVLRHNAPDWLIREAFRAYAREFYEREWEP